MTDTGIIPMSPEVEAQLAAEMADQIEPYLEDATVQQASLDFLALLAARNPQEHEIAAILVRLLGSFLPTAEDTPTRTLLASAIAGLAVRHSEAMRLARLARLGGAR